MRKDKLLYLFEKYIYGRPVAVVYARAYNYMTGTIKKRNCPFDDLDKQEVIESGIYWNVIQNKFNYPRHEIHYMLIPKRHIEKKSQLTREECQEWFEIEERYAKEKDTFMMNRIFPYASSSVSHLHLHLLSDYKLP